MPRNLTPLSVHSNLIALGPGIALVESPTMYPLMRQLLGNYVRDQRESKGWSMSRAATVVGISPQFLGRIEAGLVNFEPDLLASLISGMGLDRARLLKLSQYSSSWFVDTIYDKKNWSVGTKGRRK